MRRILDGLRRLAAWEWLTVPLAAPLLFFPTVRPYWTAAALVGLLFGWLARWLLRRECWPRTPLNRPLLLLALMIPVGIWASPLPELTLPKATGLILGLAAFRAVTLTVRDRRTLVAVLAAWLLLCLGFVAVGVVTTDWAHKVPFLADVTRRLPRLIATLPDMRAAAVHPNMIAGILTLCLPAFPALVVGCGRRLLAWLARLFLSVLFLLLTGLLVLTQSRSGWVGAAAGWLALGSLWGLSGTRRWARVAAVVVPLVIVLGVIAAVFAIGPRQFWDMLYQTGGDQSVEAVVGSISVAGRIEIWNRALTVIRDMPFTGCGLGTFREIVRAFYPLFLVAPDADIAHAHNIFLQVALDLGLPGLVAYLWLLAAAGAVCWRLARQGGPLLRPVALGLAAGLIGLHVYGLTDALALGSKPNLLFWVALALVAVLGAVGRSQDLRGLADWKRLADHLSGTGAPCPDDAADAERLIALAENLKLSALLYRVLQDAGCALPAPLQARLATAYRATLGRAMRCRQALVDIARAFAAAGVPLVVLKGLALAETVYPDLGTRVMSDLDLLVRPEDVERAHDLLSGLGYLPDAQADPAGHGEAFVRQFEGERLYLHPGHPLCPVELHWFLVNREWFRVTTRLEEDALWQRVRPLPLDGVAAWQLSAEDTVLYLCLHLAIHHRYSLVRGFVDLDRLIRCGPPLDWETLVSRAHGARLRNVVYFALAMGQEMLGMPVPAEVLSSLRPSQTLRRWVGRLIPLAQIVEGGMTVGPQSERLLHFLLVDRRRDRLAGLLRVAFPGRQWIAARYAADRPGRLALYTALHPLRMLWLALLALGQLIRRTL